MDSITEAEYWNGPLGHFCIMMEVMVISLNQILVLLLVFSLALLSVYNHWHEPRSWTRQRSLTWTAFPNPPAFTDMNRVPEPASVHWREPRSRTRQRSLTWTAFPNPPAFTDVNRVPEPASVHWHELRSRTRQRSLTWTAFPNPPAFTDVNRVPEPTSVRWKGRASWWVGCLVHTFCQIF